MLEREQELAVLGRTARAAQTGQGSIVLIDGEAGIGKSSLVDSIRSVLPAEGRLLLGWCDDLATPRVLGPLRDLREHVGTPLTAALDAGDRGRVAEALLAELTWAGHSSVLVIEDVHWVDEATLDVLRFLVARIAGLPAVLVLTYRDELAPDHPLRHLLGLVSRSPRVERLHLSRLSIDAVRRLSAAAELDPDRVYALTSGNPFLVAEVFATRDLGQVPPSIAEAVGARLSTLDPIAREAVERLSVVPSAVERWLVEAIVPGGLAALEPAEQRGVLSVSPTRVAFRHELTRRATADSLSIVRRVAANQAVLTALLRRQAERGVDLSRLLHHAAEVSDEATIVHFGPSAAAEAASAGSHREAVAHGRLVLRHRAALTPAALLATLERHAVEGLTVGLAEEAAAAQEEVVAIRRAAGEVVALGEALRLLSRIAWWSGNRPRAQEAATEAVEVLAGAGDEVAYGLALSYWSQLLALGGRYTEAIAVGERAVAIGRSHAHAELLSHALNNVGFSSWDAGDPSGEEALEESLRVALAAGEVEHACRAYVNIAWQLLFERLLDRADAVLRTGIDYAERQDFIGFQAYLNVTLGMVCLARADWDEAERVVESATSASPNVRCPALVVTGVARTRRGEPSGEQLLDDGFAIAERLAEPQRVGPAAAALLEAAWLRGNPVSAVNRVMPWYEEIRRYGHPPVAAEVGYWLRMAGVDVPLVESNDPYVQLARGDWAGAALAWQEAGYRYHHALALAQSPDQGDLLEALSILDGIGAGPLARIVRDRLRDLGVARIPRGPAPSTRDNPAGLTDRQVEVLRLLAGGMTNAEIAARLVLSVRTVDTHVAAILSKLEAPTRRDAARRAIGLGLLEGARS
jgi:DNA-binding CsgD family transcriptional regulator/tetratricopeptide (TPR) repeat protein